MPQKHVSEGSGPQWKTAEMDGKGFRVVLGEGYITNNVDSTVDMEIAIGCQDFGKIVRTGRYFADKSLLIRDILMKGSEAYLFTRPRRSGKSLALSMIDRFFNVLYYDEEMERDSFEGLKITKCSGYPYYRENIRNRCPVIRLDFSDRTFKSSETFEEKLSMNVLGSLKEDFEYLESSDRLSSRQRSDFSKILDGETNDPSTMVTTTCHLLVKHHGIAPILLIDEYDNPLATAYGKPYFGDLAQYYGGFLGNIVKANRNVSFTVMTGIQRVITDGLVSALNNLDHHGVLSPAFGQYFGLTSDEAEEAIRRQVNDLFPDRSEEQRKEYADRKFAEAREWYDGYRIGGYDIFNPWSITRFINEGVAYDIAPKNYWGETSANNILVDVLGGSGEETLEKVEEIFSAEGGYPVDQIDDSSVLWSHGHPLNGKEVIPFLVSTGYLTAETVKGGGFRVMVPNEEVRQSFKDLMTHVLDVTVPKSVELIKHIIDRKADLVKKDLERLMSGKSYFEGWGEPKYRTWLSLIFAMSGYMTVLEQESGTGRSDIFVRGHKRNPPFLIEVKTLQPRHKGDIMAALDEGFGQIIDRNYADENQFPGVIALAVAFDKKSCEVRFL